MSLRSMGVELPVDGDPVKLHGLIGMEGSFWRAECMACGYLSRPYATPGKARDRCKAHAASPGHKRLTRASNPTQGEEG